MSLTLDLHRVESRQWNGVAKERESGKEWIGRGDDPNCHNFHILPPLLCQSKLPIYSHLLEGGS